MRVLFVTRGLAPDDLSDRGRLASSYLADLRRHHAVDVVAGYTRGRRLIPDPALGVDLCGRGAVQQSWAMRRAVWQRARRVGPDLVVSESADAPRCGRPAFFLLFQAPDPASGWAGRATIARINAFTGVLVPDERTAAAAIEAGVAESLIRALPPGLIPVPPRPISSDELHITALGAIAPAQGQHLIIDAVSRLAPVEKARVRLDLAGHVEDPVYLGHLRVQAHGQPIHIHADPDPGFVDQLQGRAQLGVSVPLVADRFPLDAARMALAGTPILVANHPSTRELLGEVPTVAPADSSALRDAIRTFMDDPSPHLARAQAAIPRLATRLGRAQTSPALADWLRAMV